MKIVYVLDDTLDKTDGVQQCVITIAEYLRTQGHEVHYLVAHTLRDDLQNVHDIARYISLKFNGNSVRTPRPVSKKVIAKVLSEIQPDVIHIQMPYSPLFGARVIMSAPPYCRIVGTWHTFPASGVAKASHLPLAQWLKRTLKRVQVTIGVSKPTAEFADSVYGTHSIVVPNAVDIERFKAAKEQPSSRKRIVFLGRFDERKGPKYLLHALASLARSGYDMNTLEIVMAGKGPELDACKEIARQNGLTVEFPGFIDERDKPSLLASADVCVFPSTGGEAFGISVVEAMASGASIVLGGDNAGYRTILGSHPQVLLDPKNTEEFAHTLRWALDLPEHEARTIRLAQKQSSEQYDVREVCSQLLTIYKQKY